MLPKVSFSGTQLANRVNNATNPWLYRYRLTAITTETGSVITVNYELTSPCPAQGPFPTPSDNHSSCFPVYWGAFVPGQNGEDWFNKFAVKSVSVSDPAGGSPGLYTSYAYSRAAWHYDDNEVVKTKYRTWGQWRGYQDVITYTGNGDPQTETETTYYQGMSDDNNSTDVPVQDSQLKNHEDVNQLAGDVLESTSYLYPGGPADHSTINSYWVSPAAATRDRSKEGLSDAPLTANFTGQVEQWSRQAITDGGSATWRITETDTSYDTSLSSPTAGLPLFTFDHGDLNDTSQQRCTTITYAPANTTENLAGLPAETEVDALPCGGPNPDGSSVPGSGQVNALTAPSGRAQSNIISDTRVFYDNSTLATTWPQPASPPWPQATPTLGDVSVVRQATAYTNGSASAWQTSSAQVYDSYGRVISSYDGDGGFNGTTYTPTSTAYTMTNGNTTSTKVTNSLGQYVTTTLDPLRGLPVTITDANGIMTNLHYDGLGRLTSVWEYGRATTSPANYLFSYSLTSNAAPVVTTQKLNNENGYITSYALYDSLLRPRQTQTPTPQGGALVTDHFYDSRGWEFKTNTNWWNSSVNPGTCPGSASPSSPCVWTIPDANVADQAVTQYDGLGRPVIVTSYDNSQVKSTAYTQYTGDKVTTISTGATISTPSGATPTAVTTDALGRETELDSYTIAPSISTGTNAGEFPTVTITGGTSQATSYSFETRGWPSGIIDAATGEQWTRTYDPLGRVLTSTSPNAGTTSMTYNADGNILTTQDALGHVISYTYDPLGRKTGEYDGPNSSSPPIAAWAYDNSNNAIAGMANPIGQLTTQTSYDNSRQPYTLQAKGFNAFGEPTGRTWTMPNDPSLGALATSYTMNYQYTTNTGQPYKDFYPASPLGTGQTTAALPSEVVTHGYATGLDLPSTLGSNQGNGYQQNDTFNAFGQVAQTELGSATNNADITNTYDQHTGALTDSQVANTAVQAAPFDDTSYTYDPAGNITSQQDARTTASTSQTELQCFTYDLLDRLRAAWTTDGTSGCSAGPSTGSGGTVGDGITGGAYWTSWTYNPLGGQTQQTQHSVSGGTDTVTNYTYNNGNGTTTGQSDTLTSAITTGPGAGTATYSYDAAGNTTARNLPSGNQALAWYDDGKLESVTTPGGNTTTYIYDANGNLLLQKAPGQTTLYIFGEQLNLNTSTGAGNGQVTGLRFIPLPGGGGAVVRTGTSYWFETGDQHGTSLLTLDNTAANPTWRQFTPYGAPRGTPSGPWPDTNAYLGDPVSSGTGLDIIGARAYDPTIGRFISADPILEPTNPQTLNGYTYAASNPVTGSDPSGLCPDPSQCPPAPDQNNALQQGVNKEEQQQYDALANAALNEDITGCGTHMECVMQTIRNFTDPYYAGQQIDNYIAGQNVRAERAQQAKLAQGRAAQNSGGFWGWVNNVMNYVAPVMNVIALATLFIPGLDAITGVLAAIVNVVDIASMAVDAVCMVVSAHSAYQDFSHGNIAGGILNTVGVGLSAVGLGTTGKAMGAFRAAYRLRGAVDEALAPTVSRIASGDWDQMGKLVPEADAALDSYMSAKNLFQRWNNLSTLAGYEGLNWWGITFAAQHSGVPN
jgi:RHS repeat-associated protein